MSTAESFDRSLSPALSTERTHTHQHGGPSATFRRLVCGCGVFAVVAVVAAAVGWFAQASPAEAEGPFPIGLADRVEAFYQNAEELRFKVRLTRKVPGPFGRTIRYHGDVVMRPEWLSLLLFEGKDFVAFCAWENGRTSEWEKPGVDGCLYGTLQRSWLTAENPHWKWVVNHIRHGQLLDPAEFQGRPCSRVAFYRSWEGGDGREDEYWIDDETGRIVGWLSRNRGTIWRWRGWLTGDDSTVERWYLYEEGDSDVDDG